MCNSPPIIFDAHAEMLNKTKTQADFLISSILSPLIKLPWVLKVISRRQWDSEKIKKEHPTLHPVENESPVPLSAEIFVNIQRGSSEWDEGAWLNEHTCDHNTSPSDSTHHGLLFVDMNKFGLQVGYSLQPSTDK